MEKGETPATTVWVIRRPASLVRTSDLSHGRGGCPFVWCFLQEGRRGAEESHPWSLSSKAWLAPQPAPARGCHCRRGSNKSPLLPAVTHRLQQGAIVGCPAIWDGRQPVVPQRPVRKALPAHNPVTAVRHSEKRTHVIGGRGAALERGARGSVAGWRCCAAWLVLADKPDKFHRPTYSTQVYGLLCWYVCTVPVRFV